MLGYLNSTVHLLFFSYSRWSSQIQQIRVIKEILEDRDRMSMMTDEDKTALGLNRSHLRKQFDKVFEDVSVDLDSDQSLEPSFEGAEELEETKTEWRRRSRRSNVRKSDRISTGQVAMKKRRTSNLHAPKEEVYMTVCMILLKVIHQK